jgi:methyltransferase (TIGR00027 family)
MAEVESGPGYTATLAAVGRAFHAESKRPLVVDHLALGLAGEPGARLMAQLTSQLPEASRQSFGLAFAIRTRFVEDAVEAAIQDGVAQYVILGAGLDSFAYRRPELSERLKIFEVDRAPSQAWKRSRLEKMGVAIPASVVCPARPREGRPARRAGQGRIRSLRAGDRFRDRANSVPDQPSIDRNP